MSPRRIKTQLQVLTTRKHKPKSGDIFCFSFEGNLYYFGRVIKDNIIYGNSKSLLLYFYDVKSTNINEVPKLTIDNLLIPPIITTNHCWEIGVFYHLCNSSLTSHDVLDHHCFYWSSLKKYVDDCGEEIDNRIEPCGKWVITTYSGIDIDLQEALGIPLQWEECTK